MSWEIVLSNLSCVKKTSGRSRDSDELVVLFRTVGEDPDGGPPVIMFTGIAIDSVNEGMNLGGSSLVGGVVLPLSNVESAVLNPGIALTSFNSELKRPVPPFAVTSIGLEIDGSDSTLTQGNERLMEFIRTGTVDPTIGYDDQILWSLSWLVNEQWQTFVQSEGQSVSPVQLLPTIGPPAFPGFPAIPTDSALLSTSFPRTTWRSRLPFFSHLFNLHNTEERSEYRMTIDYVLDWSQ